LSSEKEASMAGTYLSEVYDLFMQQISDPRLIELFNSSQTDFNTYLEAWLILSINDFTICDQSLVYATGVFTDTLRPDNKVILATLMMKYWLQKNVNDITQMNLHITDRDFKMASEAQNLREKVTYLNIVKEQCSQLLQDYGYRKNNWADWYNQIFTGV
jgi:hypothetical protein